MEYTFFFFILPFIIVALPFIGALQAMIGRSIEAKQRRDLHAARLREAEIKRKAAQDAAALRSQIFEAQVAAQNDRALKAALELELLQLKIGRERKAQGLDAPEFNPQNYNN